MNMTKNIKKRYYRVDEIVWVHELKKEATVKSIDIPNKDVVVEIDGDLKTLKLWEIDKLKYKAKDKFFKDNPEKIKRKKKKKSGAILAKGHLEIEKPKTVLMLPVIKENPEMNNFKNAVSLSTALEAMNKKINEIMNPEVFFARISPDAVIPTKRDEDAGFDLYACTDEVEVAGEKKHWIVCPANETTLVSTGLAFALPKTHYLNAKHERGSTGKISMSVLAGVIDSGYRGEVFLAITPLYKDVVITSDVKETSIVGDRIYYPYSKAIAQATVDLVPNTKLTELTLEDLQKIESERGDTKLGQSGK
ncbi:dUTPase [Bacillus phage vB_BanS_Skywalker]|uniref:dUTP diphosphatase n=2 Tax=Tsamsavirus TaxID=3044849 RepID=A0AAE9CE08_9CAUD|nr:dUTPase [Bacillus phage vB_BanS_Skywalker]YP_010681021.1 dUTPase [Bacillus phage vB_BanS_MrDarsey]UGO47957.1 trimeric dUTP diphosphatase [Bacillus phage vB_BanS_MrDarsey]UGO51300.1 trimeric dUTP diphosphatase [Bacillus phage vB_BanS_Skywalker]